MRVFVTGGAGYIGSHCCKALISAGHDVVVYDNFSTGFRHLARWGRIVEGDIRDKQRLRAVLANENPDGVIHFASSIAVGESVQQPGAYYDNNLAGSLNLFQAMLETGVTRVVVSGSAAVYGMPETSPVSEDAVPAPINPYGRTKLVMEWMLRDMEHAHKLGWMSLRYFNAAGADPDGETGECHDPETHLIPNALRAASGRGTPLQLFGDDYDTPDGTCIRDYIHVHDLATAHVKALEYLADGGASRALNLGTGRGVSVRDIITAVARVTGRAVPHSVAPRRAGDPAQLVADPTRARSVLGWQATLPEVDDMVGTAWAWESARG